MKLITAIGSYVANRSHSNVWRKFFMSTYATGIGVILVTLILSTDSVADEAGNKATTKQWIKEVWQDHNSAYINEITTEDFDRVQAMAFSDTAFVRYPDWKVVVVELLAEDDKVVLLFHGTGTSAIPGSEGKTVETDGLVLLTFVNDKIAKIQGFWDNWRTMEQLGYTAVPPSREPEE